METPKRGATVRLIDPDALDTTRVKVVKVEEDYITVKYLDDVWDIVNNIIVRRQGSVRRIHWSSYENEVR